MEQFAEQITDSLIQELPDQSKFYTPKDLLSAGIPYFVVETLRDTIASTIESGMKLPDSDWIQTDSDEVKAAWHSFVGLTKQHIKVPSTKLPQLLQNAVEQCLKLMIQPRQSVPEYIYKTPTDIDFETAKERISTLEVSQQLGLALLRYMEKKQKHMLSFEEARELIKKIDQKMVENYHPLNWAQVLKHVFELAGPEVDSQLLSKFFEDKEKRKIARKFELLNKKVDESEFIEILSSADLLDVEGYEDEQQQLFGQATEVDMPKKAEEDEDEYDLEQEPEAEEEENDLGWHEEELESEETKIEPEVVDERAEQPEEKEKNIADLYAGISEASDEEGTLSDIDLEHEEPDISLIEEEDDSDTEEEIPLLNKFIFDEGDAEENTEDIESETDDEVPEQEPTSIYQEMNLVRENESKQQKGREMFSESPAGEEDVEEELDHVDEEELDQVDQEESTEDLSYKLEKEEESSDLSEEEPEQIEKSQEESDENGDDEKEEDPPMWRSFLERDDIETESGYEYEEEIPEDEYENEEEVEGESENEIEDDEGFIEEPIYDLTVTEPDPEEKIEEISKWLDDEKDRFVQEIFGNSEIAYEQALLEIMDFDDWKSASNYLEREVFARNRVEVYDEAAVDFTDRLHSYFMENKS